MDVCIQEMMRRVDLSQLLLYFVEVVDDRVLPFLAEEFDVLGVKGWDFCRNKDEQRALIKMAIQLHRYKGTPWAVERAMEQAGLIGAILVENSGTGPTGWAMFRIEVPVGLMPADPMVLLNALALAKVYKNARSVLEAILFTGLDFEDSVTLEENDLVIDADATLLGDSSAITGGFRYDGANRYNTTRNYADETDCIVINII